MGSSCSWSLTLGSSPSLHHQLHSQKYDPQPHPIKIKSKAESKMSTKTTPSNPWNPLHCKRRCQHLQWRLNYSHLWTAATLSMSKVLNKTKIAESKKMLQWQWMIISLQWWSKSSVCSKQPSKCSSKSPFRIRASRLTRKAQAFSITTRSRSRKLDLLTTIQIIMHTQAAEIVGWRRIGMAIMRLSISIRRAVLSRLRFSTTQTLSPTKQIRISPPVSSIVTLSSTRPQTPLIIQLITCFLKAPYGTRKLPLRMIHFQTRTLILLLGKWVDSRFKWIQSCIINQWHRSMCQRQIIIWLTVSMARKTWSTSHLCFTTPIRIWISLTKANKTTTLPLTTLASVIY